MRHFHSINIPRIELNDQHYKYKALPTKERLEQIIQTYISKYETGVVQGSHQWLLAKKCTIGGSEMATIQNKNFFSSVPQLIAGKIGLKSRERSIKMQWGTLFEPIIAKFVEHDKNTTIFGQDIFLPGKTDRQTYSPDGIGVIEIDHACTYVQDLEIETSNNAENVIEEIFEQKIITKRTHKQMAIALFEFKCPFNRLLKGECPDYYLPQVLTGLDVIDITAIGCFVEGMFRKCRWEDWNWSLEYDREMTPKDLKRTDYYPIARGIVIFVVDYSYKEGKNPRVQNIDLIDDKLKWLIEDIGKLGMEFCEYTPDMVDMSTEDFKIASLELPPDLGEMPLHEFEMFMDLVEDKVIKPWYSNILYRDEYTDPTVDQRMVDTALTKMAANGMTVCGMLPWKLLRCDYTYIEKIPDYVEPWLPKINEITDVLIECQKNPDNAKNIYEEYCADRYF